MLAYKYDKDTKEYRGTQIAQIDPIDGGYLLPAYCTFIEPPEYEEKEIAVFKDGDWEIEVDYRNTLEVKLSDLTFDTVKYIGPARQGYQFVTNNEYEKYQADHDAFKVIDRVFTDISDTEEYREIKRQKEAERISHLKCTKRVLVLMLEQLQYNYFETILPLIEANRQAKLEWELCVELERSNPLLNTIGSQLGITSEQIDAMFKYANGEVDSLEVE